MRLIQITDTHLRRVPGGIMGSNRNTDMSLEAVIAHIQAHEKDIDLLVLTGDLAQDADPAVYRRLHACLASLQVPMVWLPGNHDDATLLSELCPVLGVQFLGERQWENWQLLFLNTAVPGQVQGLLAASELDRVQKTLRTMQAKKDQGHLLLFLHHHPAPVGNQWMDAIALTNADVLWEILQQSKAVRALVYGHVHHAADTEHAGVRLLATPSSCVQFRLNGGRGELDERPPAYRLIELHASGALDTQVVWVNC